MTVAGYHLDSPPAVSRPWLTLKYTVPRSFTMLLCSSFSSEFISQDSLACHTQRTDTVVSLLSHPRARLQERECMPQANSPSPNSSDVLRISGVRVVGSGTFPSRHCQRHSCRGENAWVTSQPSVCPGLKGFLYVSWKVPFHPETRFKWPTFP